MDPFEEAEAKVSCYIYGQVISLFTNYDNNCSLLLLRSKLQRLVMRGSQERPLNSRQDTCQYCIKRLSPCYACLYIFHAGGRGEESVQARSGEIHTQSSNYWPQTINYGVIG